MKKKEVANLGIQAIIKEKGTAQDTSGLSFVKHSTLKPILS